VIAVDAGDMFQGWSNLDYRPNPGRKLRSVWNQRISLVQYLMRRIESFDEFARQCAFYVDTAGDYHSDFVLLPELFTTQLLSLVDERQPGLAARRLAEFTPRYLELFSDLALKYNVNVIAGSTFVEEQGDQFNVSFLFRRDGSIEKQYKIHVTPNEREWWDVQPGNRVNVMETDRGKIAILICYDIEFPERARLAVARGANSIFVPFNTNDRLGYLRVRSCAQARAIENQIYVSIAAESTPNIETVLTHDVDTELLQRNRHSGTFRPWTDRRTDLYRVQWLGDEEPETGI
jgi:predicted amidohydrolase